MLCKPTQLCNDQQFPKTLCVQLPWDRSVEEMERITDANVLIALITIHPFVRQ